MPRLVAALSMWGLFASPGDATRAIRDLASGLPRSAQRLIRLQLHSIATRSNAGLGLTALVVVLGAELDAVIAEALEGLDAHRPGHEARTGVAFVDPSVRRA